MPFYLKSFISFLLFKNQILHNGKFHKYNCIHTDICMNISTPFVEFKGGQYQDGLMASCPVEENE